MQKSVAVSWSREEGLRNVEEVRLFQRIAARRVGRFAFPDDMNLATDELLARLRKKRDGDSFEGKALGMVEDIRLIGYPDWDAPEIHVEVLFLVTSEAEMLRLDEEEKKRKEEAEKLGHKKQKGLIDTWEGCCAEWEQRCNPHGVITSFSATVVPLDHLSARTYLDSDPLDLGGMSPQ